MSTQDPHPLERSSRFIRYRGGYKYQVADHYSTELPFDPEVDLKLEFLALYPGGLLCISAGYCWDGPSGPVLDRRSTMRAALIHDALYQLMRLGKLSKDKWRQSADELFRTMCVEDGVWRWLARSYYIALRRFGDSAASTRNVKRVDRAP